VWREVLNRNALSEIEAAEAVASAALIVEEGRERGDLEGRIDSGVDALVAFEGALRGIVVNEEEGRVGIAAFKYVETLAAFYRELDAILERGELLELLAGVRRGEESGRVSLALDELVERFVSGEGFGRGGILLAFMKGLERIAWLEGVEHEVEGRRRLMAEEVGERVRLGSLRAALVIVRGERI